LIVLYRRSNWVLLIKADATVPTEIQAHHNCFIKTEILTINTTRITYPGHQRQRNEIGCGMYHGSGDARYIQGFGGEA
jgi:hypothetical protein